MVICQICGKRYDDYVYSFSYIFNNQHVRCCMDCQTKMENKHPFWFRNYLPTFVNGDICTRIFDTEEQLIDYLDNLELMPDYELCISDRGVEGNITIMQINKDRDKWFVTGFVDYKVNLSKYPNFEDIHKKESIEKNVEFDEDIKSRLNIQPSKITEKEIKDACTMFNVEGLKGILDSLK